MQKSFSERHGLLTEKPVLGDEMTTRLANLLWSLLYANILSQHQALDGGYFQAETQVDRLIEGFSRHTWVTNLNRPADIFPGHRLCIDIHKSLLLESPWNIVFDYIEDLIFYFSQDPYFKQHSIPGLIENINHYLEQERSVYRICDGQFTKLTSSTELQSVEAAIGAKGSGYERHMATAKSLLYDRKNPDYRNSIKESISALESICGEICQDQKATLGKCLSKINEHRNLHASFKEGLGKIYGWTSDDGGIRHSLTDSSQEIKFKEAQLMLVLISGFINYLKYPD